MLWEVMSEPMRRALQADWLFVFVAIAVGAFYSLYHLFSPYMSDINAIVHYGCSIQ